MEKERKHTLPFLDVLIDNKQEIVIAKVFCKTTFTDLFANFFSFTSFSYKEGLVITLINHAFKINSTGSGFHEEILSKNWYPHSVLDNIIKSKVSRLVCNEQSNANDERNIFYVKLP